MYKCGSLFSGAGGIDLAFERAGFQIAWQSEIDSDASNILAKHWPEVKNYGDITQINPADLEPVDVVAGGSPCQSFSTAGRREGLAGESRLFWEYIRVADGLAPAMVFWENVAGVLSSESGRDFALILWAFTGYYPRIPQGGWRNSGVCAGPKRAIAWRVLDAQHFGVPQRRRRLYLVGHSVGRADCVEILFEPESLSRHLAAGTKARQIAPALLANGAGTSRPAGIASEPDFCIVDELPGDSCTAATERLEPVVIRLNQTGAKGNGISPIAHTLDLSGPETVAVDVRNLALGTEVSGTVQAKTSGGYSLNYINPILVPSESHDVSNVPAESIAHTLTAGGRTSGRRQEDDANLVINALTTNVYSDRAGEEANLVVEPKPMAFVQNQSDEVRWIAGTGEITGTITARPGTKQQTYLAEPVMMITHAANPTVGEDVAPTLRAQTCDRDAVAQVGLRIRRLLPIETERLQGLPDYWTHRGADGHVLSDAARYRLVGNGVAVPAIHWIAERIAHVLVLQGGAKCR